MNSELALKIATFMTVLTLVLSLVVCRIPKEEAPPPKSFKIIGPALISAIGLLTFVLMLCAMTIALYLVLMHFVPGISQ